MGDEHLNTISTTKSNEFIKSCVENLVPNPSESEGKNGCDVPACFTTFSNVLFDAGYEFNSNDDQSLSDEDFPEEIFSNPLFEEEIISTKIDPHHFDDEYDLMESMLNHDSSIIPSSSKIDSLLDEFAGKLILLKSIPPGIDATDHDPEEDIRLIERLLYDNSSPRPPKEFVSENSDAEIEYFSPFPIPNEDKLLNNYSLSLPENESFYFDIPSFSHPPAKPPYGNTRILNIKMMGDVSDQKVQIHGLTITRFPNQEKSPDLLSHRGFKIFQLSAKCPMMIHGKNIPILDVPLFHFYPLDQLKYGGNWVKLSDLKQVKEKQENDKTETKPDENGKRGRARPSDTPVCYLCTYEQYGNILSYGTCLNCNSGTRNSFTYNPIPESFDEVQIIPDPPPQFHFNIYYMRDAHLNTILATESDEFIKSCVENHVLNPSESEGENGFDVPACFTTFLNVLFVVEYEFDSNDDQSLSDEDFPKEIFSNPLFEEEIISTKIDPHHFDDESNLIESMLNHDSSIIPSSLKIDSLLDEFAGELILLKSILPGIDATDRDPEEDISLIEKLLYDNSSPRLPKELVSKNFDAEIESFAPSPIPNEDSNSFMEEIDLSFNPDDPMSPSIEDDDYDSKRDILIHEELLDNYSLSLPENESFYFDIPSFSRPPAKPPDGNTGILNIKMMGDVSD
nr:hypothetical protein [Tanacetum cinerariifolium]